MKKIVVDGRQLCGETGGVQRFLRETILELDKIVEPGRYEILIPQNAQINIHLKNIDVVKHGGLDGLLWEQICLPYYILKNKYVGLYPCTVVPFLHAKGIAIVHDVMLAKLPDLRKSIPVIPRLLLLLNHRIAARYSTIVLTQSECSQNDIIQLYHIPRQKVEILGSGWQHIQRVVPDENWKISYPELKDGEFFFSLSANRKQKNFKWIYEMAKKYPQAIFAIAGCQEEWQRNQKYDAPNIKHLGYLTDEVIAALMQHCRAFLFPSIYEGFGIPPMEALALGAKVVCARTSCLPEIYGESVHYIDPYDYNVDLDELLEQKVQPAEKVLSRYGWDLTARKIKQACDRLLENGDTNS